MTNKPKAGPGAEIRQVLLVDDHPIVRQGMRQILEREADLCICGEASDADEALQAIASLKPDLALIDLSLRGANGIDLIKTIRSLHPQVTILVLSMHEEAQYAERVLRAGAKGYIMKQASIPMMIKAIRQVLRGEIYLSEQMIPKLLTKLIQQPHTEMQSPIDLLSDRELEVFHAIGHGSKTSQIAECLHVSVKTVETHYLNIKRKLGLKNSIELYQRAYEWMQQNVG